MQLTLSWTKQNPLDPSMLHLDTSSGVVLFEKAQIDRLIEGVDTVVPAPGDPTAVALCDALTTNVQLARDGLITCSESGHWIDLPSAG